MVVEGVEVGDEEEKTSWTWKPAQSEVLVSIPMRPDQCWKGRGGKRRSVLRLNMEEKREERTIAGVAVTRKDLPGFEEGRVKSADCHQLQSRRV